MLTYHQVDVTSIHPQDGWVEHNPREILTAVLRCIDVAIENLRHLDIDPVDIAAIGVANQRETVIVWDKISGKPLYNAISECRSSFLAPFITSSALFPLHLPMIIRVTSAASIIVFE